MHQLPVLMLVSHVGAEAFLGARFGVGTGRIWLSNVQCTGRERALMICTANSSAVNVCTHGQDAGVRCLQGASIILFCY